MPQPSTSTSLGRRRVLAGLAVLGTAGAAVTPTATASARDDATGQRAASALEPTGSLDLRGAAEAVVDDDGTTVYCSLVDGFGVVDLVDPANPTVLYEERELKAQGDGPMESIMDVKVSGDRLLVSGPNGFGGDLSGFFLYDVSDPANPERVAFHRTRFGPHNSFIDGDYVYLTRGDRHSPTMIYDVSDDDPEEVGSWSAADADNAWAQAGRNYRQTHDVYVQDDVLYVAYWDAGTWLVDVTDPASPEAIAQLGGHDPAYLAELPQISPEFRELPGNSHYVQPNADASAVFVGKEAWDASETERDGGPGGIELWDASGSDDPTLESIIQPPQPGSSEEGSGWTSHNFGVRGDRLYASWYGGGVRVYDVRDLANPLLLGEWRDSTSTSFWTAKPIESGFVATSYANPENSREEQQQGVGARVYAFPEPDDAGAEPAATMTRREFPEPSDGAGNGSSTTTTTTASSTSQTTDETTPGGSTPGGSTTSQSTTGGSTTSPTTDAGTTVVDDPSPVPGFGVVSALAGGGLGLWRLASRRRDDAR